MPDTNEHPAPSQPPARKSLINWIRRKNNSTGPGALAKIAEPSDPANDFITEHERMLLSNILKLRELKVVNVMIPRADIVAVDVNTTPEDLLKLLSEKQYSRIPVYNETLDDVLGTIHLKDAVATLARGEKLEIAKMITDIPIVSPAMTILNLLLKMRQTSRHMALVVDEYGGIDGLLTICNVIESIIGEIEDEHTDSEAPRIVQKEDGSILVDARLGLEEFETHFGHLFSEDERSNSDTISGLVFSIAGHIPARGEIITHPNGMIFEVIDADPRRINILRITNIAAVIAVTQGAAEK